MLDISLKPDTLFTLWGLPITNSLWVAVAGSVLLTLTMAYVVRRKTRVPGKLQTMFEVFIEFTHGLASTIISNQGQLRLFYPVFSVTILFFLFSNLIGLLPFFSWITLDGKSIFRPPTADYGMVFVITVAMFLMWQLTTVMTGGIGAWFKRYINLSSPLNFFLGILDIIGEGARIISLSFRLFGNIFAGLAIGLVMSHLIPLFVPVPFTILGLLGSVVQAFVFPILVLIFISLAVVDSPQSPQPQE